MVVLFVLVLPLAAQAEPALPSKVTVVNNAALAAGQSMAIKQYKIIGGKERLVKSVALGPVELDCTNGCGAEPADFSGAPGDYRIEVRTDADMAPGLTAVTFSLKAGEEYIWMVTNRGNPKGSAATAPGMELVADSGLYRIDLVTYTPPVKMNTPVQTKKTNGGGIWPFKPVNRGRAGLND